MPSTLRTTMMYFWSATPLSTILSNVATVPATAVSTTYGLNRVWVPSRSWIPPDVCMSMALRSNLTGDRFYLSQATRVSTKPSMVPPTALLMDLVIFTRSTTPMSTVSQAIVHPIHGLKTRTLPVVGSQQMEDIQRTMETCSPGSLRRQTKPEPSSWRKRNKTERGAWATIRHHDQESGNTFGDLFSIV